MKICLIKESLCLGGTERSAANISVALAEKHDVYLFLFDETIIKYPYGGKLVGLNTPPASNIFGKVWISLIRAIRVKNELLTHNADIAFLFTGINGCLVMQKMPYCKKIISCRDFGGLKTTILRFHKALSRSNAIVFNSKYQRDYFVSLYPDQGNQAFVIYNIINTIEIQKQAEEMVQESFANFLNIHDQVIVSVGRFCKEKGFDHLLHSFYIVRKQKQGLGLILVGDGELRESYNILIRQYGMEQDVFFSGFQNNPYKYMAKCNVFVLSSLSEGFPNVVPEAMACGLPVVCTNCLTGPAEILNRQYNYGCIQDVYIEADYGILTPAFTGDAVSDERAENELAKAISHILLNDEIKSRYQQLSRQRAEDFSKQSALVEIEKVLNYVNGKN